MQYTCQNTRTLYKSTKKTQHEAQIGRIGYINHSQIIALSNRRQLFFSKVAVAPYYFTNTFVR